MEGRLSAVEVMNTTFHNSPVWLLVKTVVFIVFFLSIFMFTGVGEAHGASMAFFNAIARNDLASVKHLTPRKASINQVDRKSGATPLTWACGRGIDGRIAEWLIKKGADVEARDALGETPLTTAAYYGNVEAALVLLDNGASPDTPNTSGLRPVVIASGQRGNVQLIEALLARGVRIDGQLGIEALEAARAFKKGEVEKRLKKKGARPSYFKRLKQLNEKK